MTDPIKNPIIGWYLEHYFFYVKLSDLYEREEFREMVINPAFSVSSITTAQGGTTADALGTYYSGGTGMINYVELCRRVVVDHYFRDQDETYLDHMITSTGGVAAPCASIVGNNVLDSVMLKDDDTAVDVNLIDAATTDVLTAKEVDTGMRLWMMQQMNGLTVLSYEDWLASFGVNAPSPEESHKPELLRYSRQWQYPSNTINPATGVPSSAVSWSVQERLDKARSFREPGFICGYSVARPKVYIRQQEGTFTSLLNDFRSWVPALFQGDPRLTLKEVSTSAGPLQTVVADTDGYMVDLKDLFLYGEQFCGTTLSGTAANMMDCVNASLSNVRYPIAIGDIDELFVTAGTQYVRQDGVMNLQIASAAMNPIVDTTPRGGVRSGETSGGF